MLNELNKVIEKTGELVRLMDMHPVGAAFLFLILAVIVAGIFAWKV
jgi:hypothetical protein